MNSLKCLLPYIKLFDAKENNEDIIADIISVNSKKREIRLSLGINLLSPIESEKELHVHNSCKCSQVIHGTSQ